jgi:hypothetical protein
MSIPHDPAMDRGAFYSQGPLLKFVANTATQFDVIVVGGGNAALCAALAARKLTPSVLLLERAPEHMRGGNTQHTRNIRCASVGNGDSSEEYKVEEFLEDLIGVTGGPANLDLAKFGNRGICLIGCPSTVFYGNPRSQARFTWDEPIAGFWGEGRRWSTPIMLPSPAWA